MIPDSHIAALERRMERMERMILAALDTPVHRVTKDNAIMLRRVVPTLAVFSADLTALVVERGGMG